MNASRPDLNRAAEDLRVIRSVLDQTATSFRALAPAFVRMGLVWLVCGLLDLTTTGLDLLAYYFPDAMPWWDPQAGVGQVLYALTPWVMRVLWVYLLIQCLLWQRRKPDLPALGGKVLSIWQALLVCFLLLALLLEGGFQHLTQVTAVFPQEDFWAEGSWWLFYFARWFLPALFPGIPLMVTGILLQERGLLVLGVVVFALAVYITFGAALLPLPGLSIPVGLLQRLYSPVALLVLAWRLRGRPEGS